MFWSVLFAFAAKVTYFLIIKEYDILGLLYVQIIIIDEILKKG